MKNVIEVKIRKTLWKHAKPYIDEGCVIKAVNLDTKEYEVAEDLVKLYNLHFVGNQRELLIKFLDWQYSDDTLSEGDKAMVDQFIKELNL